MVYLSNAFSIQMLNLDNSVNVTFTEVTAAEIPAYAISCIGHADTAAVVAEMLKREVEVNRTSIKLKQGDELYVAQLVGGRLPEGCTTLPDGFTIKFVKVSM